MPLNPIRQALLDIVRTPYTDVLAKISDILDFLARHDEGIRGALMGDVLCWWNIVPMVPAHTLTSRLPFTKRSRNQADEVLGDLIARHELTPDDAFEQNLPPDRVGALVLEQLAKARLHSQLIELEYLFHILSEEYVPYVGHVHITDPDPISAEEMAAAGIANIEELSRLESIFRSPDPFSKLSSWVDGLTERTDRRTSRMLIGFAFGRLMVLTRRATQLQILSGSMPMKIRVGGQPDEDESPDDDGGSDPKRSN